MVPIASLSQWCPVTGVLLVGLAGQGMVILAVAAVLVAFLYRAAATSRHLVWSLAVIGLLILPFLSLALPVWQIAVPMPRFLSSSTLFGRSFVESASPALAGDQQTDGNARSDAAQVAERWPSAESSNAWIRETGQSHDSRVLDVDGRLVRVPNASYGSTKAARFLPIFFPAVAIVWLLGALLALSITCAGLHRLARLRRQVEPIRKMSLLALLEANRNWLRVRRSVQLVTAGHVQMPWTWGVLRPVLLIPQGLLTIDDRTQQRILLHELAHIKRYDWLVQILVQSACALHWFNPLIWYAAHRIEVEREQACDDIVLASGSRASEYAADLLQLARGVRARRAIIVAAIPMAGNWPLEQRVKAILDGGRRRSTLGWWTVAIGALLTLGIVGPLASVRALSVAGNGQIAGRDEKIQAIHDRLETSREIAMHQPAADDEPANTSRLETESPHRQVTQQTPDWLSAVENNGLVARREDGRVVEIYVGTVADDPFLARLKTLPDLRRLYIDTTKSVTPAGLAHLGDIKSLESLAFYHVEIPSDSPSLGFLKQLKSLRELSITAAKLHDRAMSQIGELRNLRALRLGGNLLTDAGMQHLKALVNLEVLSLPDTNWVDSDMSISDAGLANVAGLVKLRELDLSGLPITDDGVRQLRRLTELRILRLAKTSIDGSGLDVLSGFPHLESLVLGGAGLGDEAMPHVAKCGELRWLTLSYTSITDDGFKSIARLKKLERLSLDSNVVTDRGIESLIGLNDLEHIELRATHVTDTTLVHLSRIQSLTQLDLSGSERPGVRIGRNFTGVGYSHLANLPNLKTLRLYNADVAWSELSELKLSTLDMQMPTMSHDDVRALQKALPDTAVSARWGGSSIGPDGRRGL